MNSSIDSFILEYNDLYSSLVKNGQISSAIELNSNYRKILLLSCASLYETRITNMLKTFFKNVSNDERSFQFFKK